MFILDISISKEVAIAIVVGGGLIYVLVKYVIPKLFSMFIDSIIRFYIFYFSLIRKMSANTNMGIRSIVGFSLLTLLHVLVVSAVLYVKHLYHLEKLNRGL